MRSRLQPQDGRQKKSGRLPAFIIFTSVILFLAIRQVILTQSWQKQPVLSPLVVTATPEVLSATTTSDNTLRSVVQKSLANTSGIYAVVIKNLRTNETYTFNAHRAFQTASLYKLWIMGTAYEQIQQGKLAEDLEMHEQVSVLNQKFRISPEDADLTEGDVDFTVGTALQQMITISHNYAALLLTEKLRLSTLASYLKNHDFNESTVGINGGPPTATAYDIALFLEKLYKGELADTAYTNEMLGLLKDQKLNNKLPKDLPDGVEIAHKTGELNEYSHDAGIVYLPNDNYIIVVMTQTNNPDQAVDTIGQLSRNVYEYFKEGE